MLIQVDIRQSKNEDIAAIAQLSEQLGYPETVEEVRRRSTRMTDFGNSAVFVAESDGNLVGWLQVIQVQLVVDEPLAMIVGMVVDQQYRNRGIGRLLIERAEQ